MKYKELIQFSPITTVVKLVNSGEEKVATDLVKTFVFSKKMQEDLREVILKNLALVLRDLNTKGSEGSIKG